MRASRGELRIPLPIRSEKRTASTCTQAEANPISGLATEERRYPATTSGFFFPTLSDQAPENSFRSEAVASATPSMIPRTAGPAPSVAVRKTGSRG
jgi:hypothetical protein